MAAQLAAEILRNRLYAAGVYKFPLPYLTELCKESLEKMTYKEFDERCLLPTTPGNYKFIDNPAELDGLMYDIGRRGEPVAIDCENCSYSEIWDEWLPRFRNRYCFEVARTDKKGPFIVLISLSTLSGESYVIDVRKTGYTPGLAWFCEQSAIYKMVWDKDSESRAFQNTFGITLPISWLDVQDWAKDFRVQEGRKTSLREFVMLFRGLDLRKDKDRFHSFNWNVYSWKFSDAIEALKYSAADSLYNIIIAAGLATTKSQIPMRYSHLAHILREKCFC